MKFLYGLKHTSCKENGSLSIVFIFLSVFIVSHQALGEIVVVINEIYLYSCCRDRGNLDNQRMVGLVKDYHHP